MAPANNSSSGSPSDSAAGDAALAELYARPFRVTRPQTQSLPFVFASPHSGRLYPQKLMAQSRLDALTLRRSEDAFVDELFAGVAGLGAPLITAAFPRAYCDANRAPSELDPAMFSAPLPPAETSGPVSPPSPRVLAGLGVIPRIVRDGAEIYRGKLAPEDAAVRIARLHQPYHDALKALVAETVARFGVAVVVDCHSMPSALAVPDIVLGDRYGASAPSQLSAWAEEAFQRAGFSVVRNSPYAGGFTTALYGKPGAGSYALQIEINRSLYLNEDSVTRKAGFAAFQKKLMAALTRLSALPLSALGRGMPLAAE